MKKTLSVASTALALASFIPSASALVLDFESLSSLIPVAQPHAVYFDSVYNGFKFGDLGLTDEWYFLKNTTAGLPSQYVPHSGTMMIAGDDFYNSSNQYTPITVAFDIKFEGMWFSGLAGESVGYNLYYQGNLVHPTAPTLLLASGVPQFISSGFGFAVDRIDVLSPVRFTVMDDLTYELNPVPVPEPTAYLLGLVALGGLLAVKRKRTSV